MVLKYTKPWPDIKKEFGHIVGDLIRFDQKFATTPFSANGSLFYKNDVVGYPHVTKIFANDRDESELTEKFAIGPHMTWELWHGERVNMDIDRGPCTSTSISLLCLSLIIEQGVTQQTI